MKCTLSAAQSAIPIYGLPKLPLTLQFAGETVPLSNPMVRDRLERELIKNVYKHSSTLIILKRVKRYQQQMTDILTQNNVPTDLFYLAVIESDLSPYADSKEAAGFWQFKETTAIEYNLEVSKYVDQRRDIKLSTDAACKFLNKLNETFKNWPLTTAAYNAGRTSILNSLKVQRVSTYYDLYLTPETYDYFFRILALKLICEEPEKYGFSVKIPEFFELTQEVVIDKDTNLIEFATGNGLDYNTLKYYNPWLVYNPRGRQNTDKYYEQNKVMNVMLEVPLGKQYKFLIPQRH